MMDTSYFGVRHNFEAFDRVRDMDGRVRSDIDNMHLTTDAGHKGSFNGSASSVTALFSVLLLNKRHEKAHICLAASWYPRDHTLFSTGV